jgi:hypothetical protein
MPSIEPVVALELDEGNKIIYEIMDVLTSSKGQRRTRLLAGLRKLLDSPEAELDDVKFPAVLKSNKKMKSTKRMSSSFEVEEARVKKLQKRKSKLGR